MSRGSNSSHGPRAGRALLWLTFMMQVACTALGTQDPQTVMPPVVTGMQEDGARQSLTALGFVVDTQDVGVAELIARFGAQRSAWPPPNTVVGRLPNSADLPVGSAVTLQIARYERKPDAVVTPEMPVPDVTAVSVDGAARELGQAGFQIRTTMVDALGLRARFGMMSGRWPASDTVIGQVPVGGALKAADSVVDVEVARWSLADLSLGALTTGSQTDVVRRLEAAGYRVDVERQAPSGWPEARAGDVLAARLAGRQDGQNVVRLQVASTDGRNVSAPTSPPATTASVDRDGDGVTDALDACPATPRGEAVDPQGCPVQRIVVDPDTDNDGVNDDRDLCPDSPVGFTVSARGCTLTQRVNLLPEARYAFNRQTVMEVGRPEGYRIILVLDPRTGATPTDVEARVLRELPSGDRAPPRDVRIVSDNRDACQSPIVCFQAKFYEKMKVALRVDQEGWEIRADNPVDVRAVPSDRETQWGWTVIPACNDGGLLDGECRSAQLTLDAYALIDNAEYGPIMVFNENITVAVSTNERVSSFFERHRSLILGTIVFALLLAIAAWWLSRRRAMPAPVAAPEFEQVSVLFVGANPRGTSRIRLDEEVRGIDQAIRLGERRDAFTLHQHWAARVSDLDDALMRFRPNIVHISAHGTQNGELLLEGGDGDDGKVSAAQLEKLFAILSDDIRLVVLNACFSAEQARLVVNHVDCVVGMSDAVNDKVAQRFSESFYLALANGRSVQVAFELASAESKGVDEESVPRLLALRSDPNRIEFARRAPTRHIEGVNA